MMHKTLASFALLAFSLTMLGKGSALAHSLPGSFLLFWQDDSQIELSVSLPLEDLIIASPDLGDLEDLPVGKDLSGEHMDRVAAYFAAHMKLEKNTKTVPVALGRATLQNSKNAHVGEFKLLVLYFTAPLTPEASDLALSLTYDAIMHEVRNHRATVYWGKSGAAPKAIADFGFKTVDGLTPPVPLRLP